MTESSQTSTSDFHSRSQEFIGGSTGGIPENVFVKDFDQTIPGISNTLEHNQNRPPIFLQCTVDDSHIYIRDANNNFFHFTASLEGDVLLLNMRNTLWNNDPLQKHPDIYPALLLARSLQFFKENKKDIRTIRGRWYPERGSVNYTLYSGMINSFIRKNQRPPNTEEKQAIAKATWTGMQAGLYKYSNVDIVKDTYDEVIVDFNLEDSSIK